MAAGRPRLPGRETGPTVVQGRRSAPSAGAPADSPELEIHALDLLLRRLARSWLEDEGADHRGLGTAGGGHDLIELPRLIGVEDALGPAGQVDRGLAVAEQTAGVIDAGHD